VFSRSRKNSERLYKKKICPVPSERISYSWKEILLSKFCEESGKVQISRKPYLIYARKISRYVLCVLFLAPNPKNPVENNKSE